MPAIPHTIIGLEFEVFIALGLVAGAFLFGYSRAFARMRESENALSELHKRDTERLQNRIDNLIELVRLHDAELSATVDTYTGWDHLKEHEMRGLFTTIKATQIIDRENLSEILEAATSYFNHIIVSAHWVEKRWSIEDELKALVLYTDIYKRLPIGIYYQGYEETERKTTCVIPLITTIFLQNAIKYAFREDAFNDFCIVTRRVHFVVYFTILYSGQQAQCVDELLKPYHSISFVRETILGIARQHFVMRKWPEDEIFKLALHPNETRCYFCIPYQTTEGANSR